MNKQEFKYFFDKYFDQVRRYIYYRCGDSDYATDITQEAFIKLWEKDFYFDEIKTKRLIYKISLEMYISHFRKRKVEEKNLKEFKLSFKDVSYIDDKMEYYETKKIYEKSLAKMNEKFRTVFLMNRIEKLTYKEISERIDISQKAVEKRMSNALKLLKQEILTYGK